MRAMAFSRLTAGSAAVRAALALLVSLLVVCATWGSLEASSAPVAKVPIRASTAATAIGGHRTAAPG